MIRTKVSRVIFLALLCVVVAATAPEAFGQETSQASRAAAQREDDTNLDTQLYLILATNRDVEEGKLPIALDSVMKRLHESLTFKHYSLAGTFLNRVRNNGRLEVSWVGGPFLVPASSMTGNPSFSQFTAQAKLAADESGRDVVRMNDFRFGSRVPIVTGGNNATVASSTGTSFPAINYEPIGLRTDISMREGVPVIAGTLNIGTSGDAIIVIIAARRSPN
ncbi:MAG TPA: hypothetical protein VHE60_00270 [Pyrinomonadaceae bacterium]|nr:hypothetical protein [Pyrinomonadaceae bacterium]